MKPNLTKQILTYTVVFEPAKEGGYIASVPLLPGCMTEGESFEQTIEMVKDAISGYLEVLKDQKNPIPEEKDETIITKVHVSTPLQFVNS